MTLDFEFRVMDPLWTSGERTHKSKPPLLILKQVRSLEPSLVFPHPELENAPIPREYLGRATRAELMTCSGERWSLTALRLWTNPLLTPDFGYSEQPFVAEVELTALQDVGEFPELRGKSTQSWQHTHFEDISGSSNPAHATGRGAVDFLNLRFHEPGRLLSELSVQDGEMKLIFAHSGVSESVSCSNRILLDHPDRLLREELSRMAGPDLISRTE